MSRHVCVRVRVPLMCVCTHVRMKVFATKYNSSARDKYTYKVQHDHEDEEVVQEEVNHHDSIERPCR